MCGIAGVFSFRPDRFSVNEPYVKEMIDTLIHRGPDGEGVWVSAKRNVGLGHRRLSIIDLSESAGQPMSNEDGTLWVSFNGEIYNHAELRKELENTGNHRWQTDHSDTEVILHAFEEWGIDCLEKFCGMFAIALWDNRAQALWLIRDRVGIKPLYYSIHHGRITFASEIKALLIDPEQSRKVNEESLYHYLSFLVSPPPNTMFEGINKLPGGTWMRVDKNGRTHEHKYWDVLDHTSKLSVTSDEEIAELVMDELRRAVLLRKTSDVPVGVFLSGGIDSSVNAVLFSEGESAPVKTFTIGYQGEYETYKNEMNYARQMAEQVNAKYHELLLKTDDLMDILPLMIKLQDEPLGDPVCFPLYVVSKLARDNGVTVCQVGEGADELFWGYKSWKILLALQRYSDLPVPASLKKLGLKGLKLAGKSQTHYYEHLRRSSINQPIFWGGTDTIPETVKRRLISPRLNNKFKDITSWNAIQPFYKTFLEKTDSGTRSHLTWMSYFDLNLRLPELMLMRVDKMSMGASLEGRVPFLDHNFVELAISIPESVKTRNGVLKSVLKKAVRGVIPDEIIDRKKQGFHVPVYEWFFEKLGDSIRTEMDEFCSQTDFFDRDEVFRLIDQGQGTRLWFLFNFALWWKQYIK